MGSPEPAGLARLLIVGLGSIGSRHARIARQLLPDARIAVWRHKTCDDLPDLGLDDCVTCLEHAVRFRPEAAVIASPATCHLAAAVPLANAGVHLLVEKPISADARGVPELIETCSTRRLTLMTGYNMRFLPTLQRFRELIVGKRVGRVLSVRAEAGQYLPSWRPGSDYRQTVSARAELGGGVALELSHEIDYLRWLFGDVEWVSGTFRTQSDLDIDTEDTAHLVLGFRHEPGDVPVIAAVTLDFIRHDTARSCTVIGQTGSLRWNALKGTVEVFEEGATDWRCLFSHQAHRDESYVAEWRHFLACIHDGTAPLVSGHDGLAALQVIEAARHSSATGMTAPIPR